MKYGREVLGLMRPHPNRYFSMAQIIRDVSRDRELTIRQYEATRKGIRRVLEHLIETGQVVREGEGRTVLYAWQGLGHEVREKTGFLGRQLGQ